MLAALVIAISFAAGAHAAVPAAVFDGPDTGVTGVPVGFDAEGSKDPDGGPLTYAWAIDGQRLTIDDAWLAVSFAHAGRHVVTLTVADAHGAATTVVHPIVVTGSDRSDAEVMPFGASVLPTTRALPELIVRPLAVRVARNNLRLELRCRGTAVCRGRLRAVAVVGRGLLERPLLLAQRRFTILRGGPRVVRLRLGRRARSRLSAHPRVRVTAYRGGVRVRNIWATRIYRVR